MILNMRYISTIIYISALLWSCNAFASGELLQKKEYWSASGSASNISRDHAAIQFKSASPRSGVARFRKMIKVMPEAEYTLEAEVVCNTNTGAYFEISFWDKDISSPIDSVKSMPMKGVERKRNIKNVSFTFQTPPKTGYIQILLQSPDFAGELEIKEFKLKKSNGVLYLPRLTQTLKIGETPSRQLIKQSLILTGFQAYPDPGKSVPYQTTVSLWVAEDFLCGVVYSEHQRGLISAKKESGRDKVAWSNDPLEIFITHANQMSPLYHFGIDSGANVYDSRDGLPDWDSGFAAWKFPVSETCSGIAFLLPLKDIGYLHEQDVNGCTWRLNICKTSVLNGKRHYSSMARVDSFRNCNMFTSFRMEAGKGDHGTFSRRFANVFQSDLPQKIEVRKTKNPLFRELISEKENPFKGESVYIWHHPVFPGNKDYALQYGQEFSLSAMLKEYQKNRLHPYTSYPYGKEMDQWTLSTGIGKVIYFPYHNGQNAFPYNPVVRQRLLKELDDRLKNGAGEYYGVSMGDETLLYSERMLIRRYTTPGETEKDPYLKQAAEIIKRDYGFGKYGIPSSESTREEPFARLATRKYLLAQMRALQKEISEICLKYQQKNGKPLVRFSSNPMSGLLLQDQSRMAPYCDIMTAQVETVPQPYRQRLAFYTKVLKDTTGKTVWMTPHVENLFDSYDSAAVAEFLSELARGGAVGMQLWLADCKGNERKKGSSVSCWNGHRSRWNTIMECAGFWQKENILKFPSESFGFLLSNDTSLSQLYMDYTPVESLFNLIGPGCGTWFRFIPDTAIEDGSAEWKKFPVLFLTAAKIQSVTVQKSLLEYVRNGGTLIVFDPEVFSYGCDGSDTSSFREELFGVTVKKCKPYTQLKFSPEYKSRGILSVLNLKGQHYLALSKGTESVAVNEFGNTVISEKQFPGGGKAVLAAFSTTHDFSRSEAWKSLFDNFFRRNNISVNQDIWRFTFPAAEEKMPEKKDLCLTGNYFFWWLNTPVKRYNAKLSHGKYRLSALPDSSAKNAPLEYRFGSGNLTNRLSAFEKGDIFTNPQLVKSGKLHHSMFSDIWTRPDAFTVAWDFGAKVKVREIRIFYHGELPPLTITLNGKVLQKTIGGKSGDQEVKMAVIPLPENQGKVYEIHFGERRQNSSLVLSEIEFWGTVQH